MEAELARGRCDRGGAPAELADESLHANLVE